jgi:hypothetical protein
LVDAYLFERTWAAMDDVGMLATWRLQRW